MNVLVATDGTEQSDEALRAISKFSFTDDDSIKIISVIDMALPFSIDIYGGFVPPNIDVEKAAKENADKVLNKALDAIKTSVGDKNINISTEVLFGSPESRIVETAEEIKADLIIVGSHGYGSWERLLLGSVSDSVVHHAPCSVLVVRSSGK